MWFIASSLPVKESTLIAMVMTAGSSPLIGAAAIGRLLRLNNAMILTLLVSSTILAPITLPFIALEFLNLEIGINSIDLIFRLSFLIGSVIITCISAISGSMNLLNLHSILYDKSIRYQMSVAEYRGKMAEEEHKKIFEAAINRNSKEASETLETHILKGLEHTLKIFEN